MNASAVIAESLLRQACTRLPQHAGGRARRSVGQRTPGSMPPSFAAPPWPIATRKATVPLARDCRGPLAPRECKGWTPRTVMN